MRIALMLSVMLVACDDAAVETCVEGEQAACACTNGATGAQRCVGGVFAECVCAADGGQDSDLGPDGARDANADAVASDAVVSDTATFDAAPSDVMADGPLDPDGASPDAGPSDATPDAERLDARPETDAQLPDTQQPDAELPDAQRADAQQPDAQLPDACVPQCAPNACGPDGCGGTCGACRHNTFNGIGDACLDGRCACLLADDRIGAVCDRVCTLSGFDNCAPGECCPVLEGEVRQRVNGPGAYHYRVVVPFEQRVRVVVDRPECPEDENYLIQYRPNGETGPLIPVSEGCGIVLDQRAPAGTYALVVADEDWPEGEFRVRIEQGPARAQDVAPFERVLTAEDEFIRWVFAIPEAGRYTVRFDAEPGAICGNPRGEIQTGGAAHVVIDRADVGLCDGFAYAWHDDFAAGTYIAYLWADFLRGDFRLTVHPEPARAPVPLVGTAVDPQERDGIPAYTIEHFTFRVGFSRRTIISVDGDLGRCPADGHMEIWQDGRRVVRDVEALPCPRLDAELDEGDYDLFLRAADRRAYPPYRIRRENRN